jgi:hypothetical protein
VARLKDDVVNGAKMVRKKKMKMRKRRREDEERKQVVR